MLKVGAILRDPARFGLRDRLKREQDVVIDANVVLEGDAEIGDNVEISVNCVIKNIKIDAISKVVPSFRFENCEIGQSNQVGSYARLRPQARPSSDIHINNFVEIKNAAINEGTKANHLTHIGNAGVDSKTNLGASTITANYDGINKYKTVIGDEIRTGSNCVLVTPVKFGDRATAGAGDTITRNVEDSKLALARARQTMIEGWVRPEKGDKKL